MFEVIFFCDMETIKLQKINNKPKETSRKITIIQIDCINDKKMTKKRLKIDG